MNAPVKTLRKLPIGIQSFEFLRSEGYLYVDKTELVYRLVTKGKPYFLSRPRRFGKSLLLSKKFAYIYAGSLLSGEERTFRRTRYREIGAELVRIPGAAPKLEC